LEGKRYWGDGWRIEPGEVGLRRPSVQTAIVTGVNQHRSNAN
jgi:hypothetical protein